MPALALRSPEDALLGAVGPLGLAAAAPGPALVVDLDPNGPSLPGDGSLAALVAEGPRRADLEPHNRRGFACLRNGGIVSEDSAEVVEALVGGWPFVVMRVGPSQPSTISPVELRLLVPGGLFSHDDNPAIYQDGGWRVAAPGPGPVLPKPRTITLAALLDGVTPPPDRWIRAWRKVWSLPWV
ncbi:MAG: hypothetical protein OEM94_00840 [Acidimicrobiia bacterium]|nr:hypothetical protein [Acidimicrobiia bacterium]